MLKILNYTLNFIIFIEDFNFFYFPRYLEALLETLKGRKHIRRNAVGVENIFIYSECVRAQLLICQ